MSSKAVRDHVEGQWATYSPTATFYTIYNKSEKVNVAAETVCWGTILYDIASDDRIALGEECFRERGNIVFRYYTKSGEGNSAGLVLAEAARAAWRSHVGLSGYFRITSVSPPSDLDGGAADGEWYGVQIVATYTYEHFS